MVILVGNLLKREGLDDFIYVCISLANGARIKIRFHLKKGHVVFRTLKGETKFVFQFEKNHRKGLVIQLLKSEEELAFVTTI